MTRLKKKSFHMDSIQAFAECYCIVSACSCSCTCGCECYCADQGEAYSLFSELGYDNSSNTSNFRQNDTSGYGWQTQSLL